ncbi:MAG: oxidoreductase [Chromatiales bacterium]|nr:oxidoreductase [Chromatiales bacterium]
MNDTCKAFRIHNDDGQHRASIEDVTFDDLGEGDVLIKTRFSSVNYKDALAGTGKGKILRSFPLNGGIDSCGDVVDSSDPRFSNGDQVIVTSYGLSVYHNGGYSEYLRVPADWVVKLPDGLGPFEAMVLGTAGFTAGLACYRMEQNGQRPDQGPIIVTGATGGVGSLAIDIFSQRGYEVVAVSGKPEMSDYLKQIGAARVIGRDEISPGQRPLEKGLWAGAVDNVGGEMLANLTRTMQPWGNIASIGLAGGFDLNTTVMPFIIRGVSLLGIDSQECPADIRQTVWNLLATDYRPRHLETIVDKVVTLEELPEVFEQMLSGKTKGRVVVNTQETTA